MVLHPIQPVHPCQFVYAVRHLLWVLGKLVSQNLDRHPIATCTLALLLMGAGSIGGLYLMVTIAAFPLLAGLGLLPF